MHRPSAKAASFLLISYTGEGVRRKALVEAILREGDQLTAATPGAQLPDARLFDAVIIDGPQDGLSDGDIAGLATYAKAGGSILAINAAPSSGADPLAQHLLGCRSAAGLPRAEFFGRPQAGHDLVRRIHNDFPIFDAFAPLEPVNGDTLPVLNVRVRLQDTPAVIERRLGQGRVVISGLGATEEALRTPQLRTILRRSLRPHDSQHEEKALGVGIIGYGPLDGVGYTHGLAVTNTDGLKLVAVCDRNPARLEAAKTEFPGISCYESADAIARDLQVDVAIIATPPTSHTELALQMLRAGKHVVSEKPLSLTVGEADSLYQAATASGVVLTVNQNRRWDPDFRTIRRSVEAGLVGEIFNMETFVGSFMHPCREWHSEATISGGAEYDWGSHHIDWILLLMEGMPKTVSAVGHKRVWHDVSNFDQIRVRLLWEDGREAEFVHSDVAAIRRPKYYIQGTEGTIAGHYRPLISERIEPGRGYVRLESHHAEAPADLKLMRYEFARGNLTEQSLALVPDDEPYALHRNLADHLQSDDAPLAVTFESVRKVISVLEAAHLSAERSGTPLALPA